MAASESRLTPSVLLVDDTPANLFALAAVLRPLGAKLVEARSGREAIELVKKEPFAVVLLDVQMPELDGFEVANELRQLDHGRELPIIFLTAIHREEGFAKQGYAAGAADYITKPFDVDIVRARVKAFVDLFEQREQIRRVEVGLRTRERDEALRRLVAFEQIATAALDTPDLAVFLKQLIKIFMGAADAADAAFVLLRDGDTLAVQAFVGPEGDVEERFSMPIGEGFAGLIAGTRQAAELADAASSELVRSAWIRSRGTKGLYGVPLLHDGEVLGVALLASLHEPRFPEFEKRLFGAMVERAAWAVARQLARSRLHEVLLAAPAMMSVVRVPSMMIEFANPRLTAFCGGRTLVGRHLRESGLDAAAQALVEDAHRRETSVEVDELTMIGEGLDVGPDPRRYFRFTAQPLRNAAGAVDSVLTFAFDVTAQVQARQAIEAHEAERSELLQRETKARAAAEVASRAKDAFLATVSHELRTPLNAILGWTVMARAKAPPELDRALGTVERNARAQARIIEDVLDISRIVSGRLRLDVALIDLRELTLAALESVRPAADARGIAVELVEEGPIDKVHADAERMQQVFWNLLSNAIKFTPKGGRITVHTVAAATDVVVCITDMGEGIAADFLPYVFEPFRQQDESTTRRHAGLGLGLAIVKQLVHAHGGSVAARSEGVGKGATFEVRIPRKLSAPLEQPLIPPLSAPLPRSVEGNALRLDGLKVLVVDDDEDARILLCDVFKQRGAIIAEAASADAAFKKVEMFRPDVIVSDISMPGGDGYGLIRAVRKLAPDGGGGTPAIALTGHARAQDAERAIAAGFHRCASKPVDLERLVSIVANLGGISFGDPGAADLGPGSGS